MATPKELVAEIAAQTGVPESTIIVHDRNLAEAGLRSPALRGRGVSRVTYQDAANLIIAAAGSRNVKDSVRTVLDYAALKTDHPLEFGDEVRGATFGDAIAALLEAVPASRDAFSGSDADEIIVELYGPEPRAVIEIKRADRKPDRREYEAVWPNAHPRRDFADLKFIAQFSQVTIGHVGALVTD